VTTILTGLAVGIVAAFANIDEIVQLTNIGTLFAFVSLPRASSSSVTPTRTSRALPDAARAVRADRGDRLCGYLMAQLPWVTWVRFVCGWPRPAVLRRLWVPPQRDAAPAFALTRFGGLAPRSR